MAELNCILIGATPPAASPTVLAQGVLLSWRDNRDTGTHA